MKKSALLVISVGLLALGVGCQSSGRYHKTALPDPEAFNAHFDDMDTDGNGLVNPEEFNAFFQNADPGVFSTLDLNQDGGVDHDEWHRFKEAHGLKEHE